MALTAPSMTKAQHAYIAELIHEMCWTLKLFHMDLGAENYIVEVTADYLAKTGPFDRKQFKKDAFPPPYRSEPCPTTPASSTQQSPPSKPRSAATPPVASGRGGARKSLAKPAKKR